MGKDVFENVYCLSERNYKKQIDENIISVKTCNRFLGNFKKGVVDSSFKCPACGTLWRVFGTEEDGYTMKPVPKGEQFIVKNSSRIVLK